MQGGAPAELRVATRGDLDAILEIEQIAFRDPWSPSAFTSEIESEAPPVVAVADGRVVGYLCRMLGPEELHITNLAVDPAYRRRGISRALLADTIEFAAAKACAWIYLDVRPSNTAARALYEGFGFVEIYRRRKYYIRPQEDGLVLARPAAPRPPEGGQH
jgi:ribosomal-protein-alanine N-acetyltransferase